MISCPVLLAVPTIVIREADIGQQPNILEQQIPLTNTVSSSNNSRPGRAEELLHFASNWQQFHQKCLADACYFFAGEDSCDSAAPTFFPKRDAVYLFTASLELSFLLNFGSQPVTAQHAVRCHSDVSHERRHDVLGSACYVAADVLNKSLSMSGQGRKLCLHDLAALPAPFTWGGHHGRRKSVRHDRERPRSHETCCREHRGRDGATIERHELTPGDLT